MRHGGREGGGVEPAHLVFNYWVGKGKRLTGETVEESRGTRESYYEPEKSKEEGH